MPVVQIDLWEDRSKEDKKEIMETVSEDIADILGIKKEIPTVIIRDIPLENWCFEGVQSSELSDSEIEEKIMK